MIKVALISVATILLSGCYTAQDLENDRRQDLIGYILGLDGHSETEYE